MRTTISSGRTTTGSTFPCCACAGPSPTDLVLPAVVQEMQRRGPGARGLLEVVEVPGCGHAPALNVPQQLAWVQRFLQGQHAQG